jgi:hypothetical protein
MLPPTTVLRLQTTLVVLIWGCIILSNNVTLGGIGNTECLVDQ